jgi:hypothetical protein
VDPTLEVVDPKFEVGVSNYRGGANLLSELICITDGLCVITIAIVLSQLILILQLILPTDLLSIIDIICSS